MPSIAGFCETKLCLNICTIQGFLYIEHERHAEGKEEACFGQTGCALIGCLHKEGEHLLAKTDFMGLTCVIISWSINIKKEPNWHFAFDRASGQQIWWIIKKVFCSNLDRYRRAATVKPESRLGSVPRAKTCHVLIIGLTSLFWISNRAALMRFSQNLKNFTNTKDSIWSSHSHYAAFGLICLETLAKRSFSQVWTPRRAIEERRGLWDGFAMTSRPEITGILDRPSTFLTVH